MAHRKQGYRFDDDWNVEQFEKFLPRVQSAKTIPVNIAIEAEQLVLNLEKVKDILNKAYLIILADCICRKSFPNCDAPLDVCISINDLAERVLTSEEYQNRNPRKATFDEAIDALERSHKSGLVHMAYALEQEQINWICSCCSCCCGVLSAILRYGLAPNLLTSDTTTKTDTTKCTSCGVCVERCQFGARKIVNGSLVVRPELCFGCGLCISTCPTGAVKIVNK